ncbi:endonuclease/exonuclease/phosphatase family protein [Streptomyces sp. x-19]|uniref:endonuclease/exonuclease/phosphatase family protein n=1 Tax=Streptomyces sp. x-19 TaxID=2789280 RepID=UPI0039804CE5
MNAITLLCWNQENNGNGDPKRRHAGDTLLKSLNPDLVYRQELWDAGADGSTIFNDQAHTLGLQGVLGEDSCTGLFYNPATFSVVRDWRESRRPHFVMPPTALTLRYEDAGPKAVPFIAVSYHLNYGSAVQRLLEAEWLTTWADKSWTTADGCCCTVPAIFGGDGNFYPTGVPGDLPLPDLAKVKNRPHRTHRSCAGPSGTRLPDTAPYIALRTAGLEDAAAYWATAPHGDPTALSCTVNACDTHGPDSRVDLTFLTPELLPAIIGFEVIKVAEDISDHHVLRLTLDRKVFGDILNHPVSD